MTVGSTLQRDLDLAPLPDEGGWFRQTYLDDHHSKILFLVADGEFSALHRLSAPEEYIHLAGAPLDLLILDATGARRVVLDRISPRWVVEPGSWQGSASAGEWTLVTTQVTPPFDWPMFELGSRATLQQRWPTAADRIAELTRS